MNIRRLEKGLRGRREFGWMCEGEGGTTKNYTAIRVTTFSLCLEPYTSVGGIYIASSFLIPCCSLCMDKAYGLEKKGAKFKGAI